MFPEVSTATDWGSMISADSAVLLLGPPPAYVVIMPCLQTAFEAVPAIRKIRHTNLITFGRPGAHRPRAADQHLRFMVSLLFSELVLSRVFLL
jgi:hypothetical protein